METVMPSDFKRGMVIMLDGVPQVLEDYYTTGTAQTRHKLHVKLRQLVGGKTVEKIFAENERVPLADLEYHPVQFSYKQGTDYVFSNTVTYEEVVLSEEQLGDRHYFIKDEDEYKASFLSGKLMDIELPLQVVLEVAETAPGQKGGTMASWKPAKMVGGLELMVPLFISNGDKIRVSPQDKKYLGKDNTGGAEY
jgi:elongation factor P